MYSNISDGVSAAELTGGATVGYRREFEEMECRIRKCERHRAELERQFAELMRERAESERAAARALKQRHKRLMEAERQRAERNESILRMLNKIDQQAASLAAKSDRLKMLKTQYEMYLMRTYTSAQSMYSTYNPMPMLAAPPTAPILKAPPSPSKSSFAQYLSDLTHQQQQASVDPIPPPTALSNYLASQPKSSNSIERPYSRMLERSAPWEADVAQRSPTLPVMASGGTKAKRFEMSNEDFIRYIDSEVLKEPVPEVNVLAVTPVGHGKAEEVVREAYLEDAGMSEDEQRPLTALTDRLTEDIDRFSIGEKDSILDNLKTNANKDCESLEGQLEMQDYTSATANDLVTTQYEPSLELYEPDKVHNESVEPSDIKRTPENEASSHIKEIEEEVPKDNMIQPNDVPHASHTMPEHYDVPQPEPTEQWPEEERKMDQFIDYEHIPQYPTEARQDTTNLQQAEHKGDDQPIAQAYHEQFYQSSNALHAGENVSSAVEERPADVYPRSDSQHGFTQEFNPASEANVEQYQPPEGLVEQPMQQSTVGSQRWSTARQAMRAKAFPVVPAVPPTSEINPPTGGLAQEQSYGINYDTAPKGDGPTAASNETVQASESAGSAEQNAIVYPEYTTGANDQSYYAANAAEEPVADPQQVSSAEGYQNDGMGQPINYQVRASHEGDQQMQAMYQYQQPDGQQTGYQEGQYAEAGSAEQYQYAEGADQAVNPYGMQEGYHDPNQQYQYDQNAQYYEQQQQQGYDGQYYSENPQQQQEQQQVQQYYMDDANQQQQLPGHYEQQDPNQVQQQQGAALEQYRPEPADNQAYQDYPVDAQQAPAPINPVSTGVTDPTATANETRVESPKPVGAQSTADPVLPVEASPVTDASPPKAGPEKKGSNGKQANNPKSIKKDTEPASDTPTVSTINDESDFDFSTQ